MQRVAVYIQYGPEVGRPRRWSSRPSSSGSRPGSPSVSEATKVESDLVSVRRSREFASGSSRTGNERVLQIEQPTASGRRRAADGVQLGTLPQRSPFWRRWTQVHGTLLIGRGLPSTPLSLQPTPPPYGGGRGERRQCAVAREEGSRIGGKVCWGGGGGERVRSRMAGACVLPDHTIRISWSSNPFPKNIFTRQPDCRACQITNPNCTFQ